MRSTTYNDKTEKVGITLPSSLIKQMDKLRGDIPRSTYIRRAIERYVKQSKEPRPLRKSRHLEAGSRRNNETRSPTYSLSPPPMVI
jgi:hypothetical protein